MNLDFFDISHFSNGLLLLSVSVMGNYIAQTLGCQTQRVLENNMFAKKFVLFMIIYFTLNITNKDNVHPLQQLTTSFFLWIFFIIFSRMNITFTIVVFLLLSVSYTIKNFQKYYTENDDFNNNKELIEKLQKYNKYLAASISLLTIIGFTLYFMKERKEKKNFSFYYFIFGKKTCDSLK